MRTPIDLRPRYLDILASAVEVNRSRFDETTGRFLTGTGWAVTNQDIIYPLALLYRTPGTRWFGDPALLDLVARGGDALREFQNPDGTVEFVKVDGSTWGPIYMPWSMYHWLEAYVFVRDELDPAQRLRWEEGLTLAYDGISAELDRAQVHNIPVWNANACRRAGDLFGRSDWAHAGDRMIERAVAAQDPRGFWAEHGGPTPGYNFVYVHALGIYHSLTGDDSVLVPLRRAAEFHIRYTYPDGRTVEAIDGRVKYHDRLPLTGHPGLSYTPQGRRYVEFLLDLLDAERKAGKHRESHTLLSPHLASAFVHVEPGTTEPILQDAPRYEFTDPGIARVTREPGWFTCRSVCTVAPVESRWGMDRQSFLSVWNDRYGLLVGGGNSKQQSEWSSFQVESSGVGKHIPDRAEASVGADGDRCAYHLGDSTISVSVLHGKERLELSWEGPAGAVVRLPLRLHEGARVETSGGFDAEISAEPITLDAAGAGAWIETGDIRIELPEHYTLTWPSYPFNPYAADGAAPIEEAVAMLELPLGTEPVRVRFCAVAGTSETGYTR